MVTTIDDALVSVPERPVRLENIPAPSFDELPLDKYFAPGPILPVYASRSCAWQCAFCSIPFASNSFRARPAAQTVAQLAQLMAKYNTKTFMFVDEILTLRSMRLVAQEIVDQGLDMWWYGETRFARGFTRELADLLYQSGCRRLNFGLESYNQRVLDLMDKGTKIEDIDSTLDNVLAAGISPHLFVIHGFPGETAEETQRTITYAQEKVREAETRYGNKYTTWGGSPFILDVHSPIAQDPARFGIEIHPAPPDQDLSLVRDYSVRSGVGQAEVRAIAEQSRSAPVVNRTVWFRTKGELAISEVEEFTFLRACLQAPNAEPLRGTPHYCEFSDDAQVVLTAAAQVLPWPADDGSGAALLALYHGDGDRFVQLTWPREVSADILQQRHQVASLATWFIENGVNWGQVTGAPLVHLLVRHGFVTVELARLTLITDTGIDRWTWKQEPAVIDSTQDETVILHSPVTGNTVRANVLGQLIWHLCQDGTSVDEIVADLPDPLHWRQAAVASLAEFSSLGFIYPAAPAPQVATI